MDDVKRLRRSEVHERLKQNYEALCARCPPMGGKVEMLDDSLTNLQWLWNLNVSMTCPIDPKPVDVTSQRYNCGGNSTKTSAEPRRKVKLNKPAVQPSKPAYTLAQIVCMAIESSNHKRLTFPAICKWIKGNFTYYSSMDSNWQNSVMMCLMQSNLFRKSSKCEATTKCLWEIKPKIHTNSNASMVPTNDYDSATDYIDFNQSGRKRKQSAPQKVIRKKYRKRRNISEPNLLEEQAPELGSLKGDFNWNSIFDGFFNPTEDVCPQDPKTKPNEIMNKENGENYIIPSHEDIVFPEETAKSDLDLTITGHQIEIPDQWIPVGSTLDDILCEKSNDNSNIFNFQPNHPWQEVENATDVIEDLLMTSF